MKRKKVSLWRGARTNRLVKPTSEEVRKEDNGFASGISVLIVLVKTT